jgi:hypothetical protein
MLWHVNLFSHQGELGQIVFCKQYHNQGFGDKEIQIHYQVAI